MHLRMAASRYILNVGDARGMRFTHPLPTSKVDKLNNKKMKVNLTAVIDEIKRRWPAASDICEVKASLGMDGKFVCSIYVSYAGWNGWSSDMNSFEECFKNIEAAMARTKEEKTETFIEE